MKYYLWKILIQIAPSSTELYKTTKPMTQVFCLFYLFTSYKLYVALPYIWDISLSTLDKFRTAGTWIWIQKNYSLGYVPYHADYDVIDPFHTGCRSTWSRNKMGEFFWRQFQMHFRRWGSWHFIQVLLFIVHKPEGGTLNNKKKQFKPLSTWGKMKTVI